MLTRDDQRVKRRSRFETRRDGDGENVGSGDENISRAIEMYRDSLIQPAEEMREKERREVGDDDFGGISSPFIAFRKADTLGNT